ncbi:adult-specific cuticular protein ACP-22-like [Bombus impatiens]|uniref:Adult-specific cuticular protein ACP-22-like n=1 Tax=Bombus impatiens TaxID=132113 RepID=A0A6P8LAD4_BOMIM|nr:adult-specific cuticular protein ACP-22-like [Bombus impatiens]
MALIQNLVVFALISITFASAQLKMFHEVRLLHLILDDEDTGGVDRAGHSGGGGHGHAYSFHHFSGPVVGHHEEISWKDKHGHHHHDYKAHPKYKFAYGVDDKHTKDYHGQKEHRDGKEVEGEYHIHEPGGNMRSVKYHSHPHGGFFAEVHNYGGNDHSGGTYGGHKHR